MPIDFDFHVFFPVYPRCKHQKYGLKYSALSEQYLFLKNRNEPLKYVREHRLVMSVFVFRVDSF